MKNLILFLSFVMTFSFQGRSSHNPGGDARIQQIGANQFIMYYRQITFSTTPLPNSISTNIYSKVTDILALNTSISLDSIQTFSSGGYSVNVNYYSDTITLPNNPNGYYSVYSICCRTVTGTGGIVFTCEIPDPAILGGNSNPNFTENPGRVSMCINQSKPLDFSCTDLDGDSLVYSLLHPYSATATGGIKPFSLLTYNSGFSLSNILGPGSVCTINTNTGIVTTLPRQMGIYVIAVKCEEYRNGIKIGEVIRDVTVHALNCPFVSINENKLNKLISVYPNPSNGIFNIETPSLTTLKVYNVYGVMVHEQSLNGLTNGIQLKNCSKGIYTLMFISKSESVIKKIVVK